MVTDPPLAKLVIFDKTAVPRTSIATPTGLDQQLRGKEPKQMLPGDLWWLVLSFPCPCILCPPGHVQLSAWIEMGYMSKVKGKWGNPVVVVGGT